jgi:hypothetical protein
VRVPPSPGVSNKSYISGDARTCKKRHRASSGSISGASPAPATSRRRVSGVFGHCNKTPAQVSVLAERPVVPDNCCGGRRCDNVLCYYRCLVCFPTFESLLLQGAARAGGAKIAGRKRRALLDLLDQVAGSSSTPQLDVSSDKVHRAGQCWSTLMYMPAAREKGSHCQLLLTCKSSHSSLLCYCRRTALQT